MPRMSCLLILAVATVLLDKPTYGFLGNHLLFGSLKKNKLQQTLFRSTTSPSPPSVQHQKDDDDDEDTAAHLLRSVTICNIPRDQEPELLCDFLMEIGACSTAITDSDRGTDREQPLFGEPLSNRDPWQDSLQWAAPIWNRCNVTAHFPSSIDLQGIVELIADVFPDQYPLQEYAVDQVPNRDWVVHVQQSWKPILIGPYVLRFPWHSRQDVDQAIQDNNNPDNHNKNNDKRVELLLQGGIAFGTGEHPTTQLCMEWIHHQVDKLLQSSSSSSSAAAQQQPITIMDYGAGSGILGMAACALDRQRVRAIGVDIDVDAIHIANANAAINGVNMQSYLPPLVETADDESKSLLLKAHAHAQKQLQGDDDDDDSSSDACSNLVLSKDLGKAVYDMAVANILAGPLVALSSTIASLVRPGGQLAMSGILTQQADMVVDAYKEYFEDVKVERELDGWILVTGVRKQQ
ncbi:protein L11 methyltransferase [Seminavis robusta]|uniref:ETFB lysine methyltransferase n=1 Tax=Seminavis robusta TaxID=568900 RepID=A0A9N8DH14_9STRA|nr:protein L11 methyltransferase [Seminavis robusta]|eukprot:Sro63_g035870.1 protein L11 methyltransferase (462) ;mRNA; f:77616-79001